MKKLLILLLVTVIMLSSATACFDFDSNPLDDAVSAELDSIPAFDGKNPYVIINDNLPFFTEGEITSSSFERYSDLDSLGRCGEAVACIGTDLMPTEDRESISSVTPSGWINAKYDIVDGSYLYHRAHLIGFQLAGENANEENLITGTSFMNVKGMLPFENDVAEYVEKTKNHVMYRVTPIFENTNLVASGVLMEALSVEDGGKGISFCVYVYNAQPGIVIDYSTGRSRLATEDEFPDLPENDETDDTGSTKLYVINTNSGKFHLPDCAYAKDMNPSNRREEMTTKEDLIFNRYTPCKSCIHDEGTAHDQSVHKIIDFNTVIFTDKSRRISATAFLYLYMLNFTYIN